MPILHTAPRLGGVERLESRHLMATLAAVDAPASEAPLLELPASVAGRLFVDDNADGARQAFEAGVAGAAIELVDLAGRTVATTVSARVAAEPNCGTSARATPAASRTGNALRATTMERMEAPFEYEILGRATRPPDPRRQAGARPFVRRSCDPIARALR